jgi:integrase
MKLATKSNPVLGTSEKNALKISAFRFLKDNSATTMPQVYSHYRPPRLVQTTTRSYVEYWYRVPDELYSKYKKEWMRFRVFEDINRHKSDEYAQTLLKAVKDRLQSGFNPFDEERRHFVKPEKEPSVWSLNAGLDKFMEYCHDKKLRKKTIQSYGTLVNFLKEYFLKDNRIYDPLPSFAKDDLKGFVSSMRKAKGWNNYTTNNYIGFAKMIFNWFVKEDIIVKSPAASLEMLPVNITRHKYYSDDLAEKIKKALLKGNPELYQFCEFIYYTCTRPKSEARLLQVKHILFDRKLLFVPAHISKNKTDDYIPLGEQILEILQDRKKQPADHYIFGGEKPRSQNLFAMWYKPYKDKFGLGEEYTLYSWKHSRAVHLAQAGADPYQIMRLMRHSSLEITMKYLRDLGHVDLKEIHAKTKTF